MGWIITLGLLVLLAILPLGVRLQYNGEGFRAAVKVSVFSIAVYPMRRKPKKKVEKPKPAKPEKETLPKPPQPPQSAEGGKTEKGGSLRDFLPLVKLAWSFLRALRRKLRIPKLEVKLILGGDDPCDLAVNYGRACGAVANLIPQLERYLTIKKREIGVACDFTASQTTVIAHVEVTITLGRLLSLLAVYGFRGVKEFLQIKKKRKGGAVT